MHPGGTAWEVRPPARVVESGAAGRAVSAMVEEKRGRKGMLTSAIPSLPTGAIQGTLHPPPTRRLAAPGQVIPMLDGNTGTPQQRPFRYRQGGLYSPPRTQATGGVSRFRFSPQQPVLQTDACFARHSNSVDP